MNHWHTPTPATPRNVVLGAWLLAAAIILMTVILVAGKAGASPAVVRCGGPCPIYPTTTQYVTTTAATTTVPQETTTIAPTTTVPVTTTQPTTNCGLCAGQFSPTTTVPAVTTTVPAATTVPPAVVTVPPVVVTPAPNDTTAVDQTVAPVPAAAEPVSDTLPVTGGSPWWLALVGVCLVALGLLGVAFKRS